MTEPPRTTAKDELSRDVMLAGRVHDYGTPPKVEVEEVPVPHPAPGEVLVRVEAAVLGHIDLTIAGGSFPVLPDLPYVPGTEAAGVVIAPEGPSQGKVVRIRGRGVGLHRPGAWAQFVAVPEAAIEVVPDGTPPAVAAAYYSPACTAELAISRVGGMQSGEVVGITGASGAVGSMAAQLALRAGAAEVYAVVRRASRPGALPDGVRERIGAPLEAIAADERLPDLWIDTVGGEVLEQLPARTRPGGRIACIGYMAGTTVCLDLPALLHQDVGLLPVNLMRHARDLRDVAPELLRDVVAGTLDLAIEEHSLQMLPVALARLVRGEARGRVVLLP